VYTAEIHCLTVISKLPVFIFLVNFLDDVGLWLVLDKGQVIDKMVR